MAVPWLVLTLIDPVLAPAGTVAVSWLVEVTLTLVASTPLNETLVAPAVVEKPLPVTLTLVPTGPVVGEKPVMATLGLLAVTSCSPPMKAVVEVESPLPVVTTCSATRWPSPS